MSLQDHILRIIGNKNLFNFEVHVILTKQLLSVPHGMCHSTPEDISNKHWAKAKQIVTPCWKRLGKDVHVQTNVLV